MNKLNDILNGKRISDWADKNRKELVFCLIVTFIWGLVAHGYMFFNNFPSHDSLNEFYGNQVNDDWKIGLGRFVVPIYRHVFRGNLTLPWLVGLLSLFFVAVAVFFTVKIFSINSKVLAILVSGIMVTNPTVIAECGTYLHDMDVNMLAMLMAVLAAYLWKEHKGFVPYAVAVVMLVLSMGIYQSYISLTITYIILVSIYGYRYILYQHYFTLFLRQCQLMFLPQNHKKTRTP